MSQPVPMPLGTPSASGSSLLTVETSNEKLAHRFRDAQVGFEFPAKPSNRHSLADVLEVETVTSMKPRTTSCEPLSATSTRKLLHMVGSKSESVAASVNVTTRGEELQTQPWELGTVARKVPFMNRLNPLAPPLQSACRMLKVMAVGVIASAVEVNNALANSAAASAARTC